MSLGQVNGLKPKVSSYIRAAKLLNTTYTSICFIPCRSYVWIINGWCPVGCDLTLCFSSLQCEPDLMSQPTRSLPLRLAQEKLHTTHFHRRFFTPWVCDVTFHTTVTKREIQSDSARLPRTAEFFFFSFAKISNDMKRHNEFFRNVFPVFFYGMWNSLLGIDELFKTPSWTSWELC